MNSTYQKLVLRGIALIVSLVILLVRDRFYDTPSNREVDDAMKNALKYAEQIKDEV